jgi:hypothetical protein
MNHYHRPPSQPRSGRALEFLLTVIIAGSVAVAVIGVAYTEVILPAFEKATVTLQQLEAR